MLLLIHGVLKQERRMDRYAQRGSPPNRSMTIKTSWQGLWYITAFGIAWTPWYAYVIIEFNHNEIPDLLNYIYDLIMPLQGVLNAMVYFRPMYKTDRERHPTESRASLVLRVLNITLPIVRCSCMQKSKDTVKETEQCRREFDERPKLDDLEEARECLSGTCVIKNEGGEETSEAKIGGNEFKSNDLGVSQH